MISLPLALLATACGVPQDQYDAVAEELSNATGVIAALEGDLIALGEQVELDAADKAELAQRVEDLDLLISELEEDYDALVQASGELVAVRSERDALRGQVELLRDQADDLRSDVAKLEQQLWPVVGQVEPEGVWAYSAEVSALKIWTGEREITDTRQCPPAPRCGGLRSRLGNTFVHIYHATETGNGTSRDIVIAAWGNSEAFEAAVFSVSEGQLVIDDFRGSAGMDHQERLTNFQEWVAGADDLIKGRTFFAGDLTQ